MKTKRQKQIEALKRFTIRERREDEPIEDYDAYLKRKREELEALEAA